MINKHIPKGILQKHFSSTRYTEYFRLPSNCSEPYSILITQRLNIINRLLLEIVAGIVGSMTGIKIEKLYDI